MCSAWPGTDNSPYGEVSDTKVIRNMTVLQMFGSVPSQPDFTTVESSR